MSVPDRERAQPAQNAATRSPVTNCSEDHSRHVPTGLDKTIQNITLRFIDLDGYVQDRLEELRSELKKTDEPTWSDHLAAVLVTGALTAGAIAGADLLAGLVAKGAEELTSTIVKKLLEIGIKEGVPAGLNALTAGPRDVDGFIKAQKDGARALHQANRDDFVNNGQDKLTSLEEATALLETMSKDNLRAASEKQKDASRDSWMSFLSQATFGAGTNTDAGGNTRSVTDMRTQSRRDLINHGAPHHVTDHAPTFHDAKYDGAPGVLAIRAELPAIQGPIMYGGARVEKAILNGVNGAVRKAYEHKPLRDVHIARQIVAKVNGDLPDFTLNLDEQGIAYMDRGQAAWLEARADVGSPKALDPSEKRRAGIELLLGELVATGIDADDWYGL